MSNSNHQAPLRLSGIIAKTISPFAQLDRTDGMFDELKPVVLG